MKQVKKHLHNFFIPHEGNNHLSHSVKHKHLWYYSSALVTLKIALVALLFITFPSIAEFSTITQARIAELVNQTRRQFNLSSVKINPVLQKAAELKLQDMINQSYFAHTSPQGVAPWAWFKEAGYLYTYAGENLAMNFTEAEEAHQAWLASPTHRANIVNPNYQEIGVAVGVARIDGQPATLVVQLLGTSFSPPSLVGEPLSTVQGEEVAVIQQPGEESPEPAEGPQPEPELPIAPETPELEPQAPEIISELIEAPLPAEPQTVTRDITGGAEEVTLEKPEKSDVVGYILRFVQKFYWIILGFVVIALLLKIAIRIHIQHKRVIVHGLMVIAIGLLLLALNLHFLEAISGPVIIY